jgi:hypothetical protein
MPEWKSMTKKQRFVALTRMAEDGYSFRLAAVELNTTRSTIAGFASRQGIQFSHKRGPKPKSDPSASQPKPSTATKKAKPMKATKPKPVLAAVPDPAPEPEKPVLEAVEPACKDPITPVVEIASEPIAQPKPSNDNAPKDLLLVDRERWQCAYPLWDEYPGPDKAFCCGKPVKEGTSYCPAHAEILLVPPRNTRLAPFARGAIKR